MARHRGKKALYEVMSKGRLKLGYNKTLERLHSSETVKPAPASDRDNAIPKRKVQLWSRPKLLQLNDNRLEISIPYQLAVAIALGLVLLLLVAFRLGELRQRMANKAIQESSTEGTNSAGRGATELMRPTSSPERTPPGQIQPAPVDSQGNNRIVIQAYAVRAHLEPVMRYFAQFSIETEIRKIDDWYYLVTKNKYDNPEKPGTNGYFAKQKIVELGAKYQAPPGYETFGSKPFHDAYGMRFDD